MSVSQEDTVVSQHVTVIGIFIPTYQLIPPLTDQLMEAIGDFVRVAQS
jgi:hypothetical protein